MSTSVHSSSGLSGWRVIVVGMVAILAATIGVSAGSFLLSGHAGLGAAASYVPASAPVYLELRLEPSAAQDVALRDLLRRFPPIDELDLERPLYAQLAERLDEMLAAEADLDLSWSDDVATWFDGRVAMAATSIPDTTFDQAGDPFGSADEPDMLVVLGVTDADAARAAIDRLLDQAAEDGPPVATRAHRGTVIHVAEGHEGGAFAVTGDALLIAPTVDQVEAALDTHASATRLSDSAEMLELADQLPADWLAFTLVDLSDVMTAAVDAAGASFSGAYAALLEQQPMRAAMAITAGGDRLALEVVTPAPTGQLAVVNAERGLAREVPADAIAYAEGGNLGRAVAAMITAVKETAASEPDAAAELRTAEAALGADLEELVSWIDDGAVAVGWDGMEPYVGLVLVPNDRAAADRRLSQLASFARLAALDQGSGVSISESEVAGTVVTTIRWEDPGAGDLFMVDGPTGAVVEYALTDDRVLIGFGDRFVRRALVLDPADALAAQARFADAIGRLGDGPGTGIGWLDLVGMREALEASFGDEPGYRSDVRPWLLPLDAIVSVSRLEGDLHVQRAALLVE